MKLYNVWAALTYGVAIEAWVYAKNRDQAKKIFLERAETMEYGPRNNDTVHVKSYDLDKPQLLSFELREEE
jgi:hypothetical protein